jgi:hypothetical protein
MTDEEIYSPEEKRAFHLVGEFLGWFARLEAVIDRSIIDILGLEQTAGQLLMTYVNFASKCTMLKELAMAQGNGLSKDERDAAKEAVGKILDLAATRNIVAHSMFSPSELGIQFSHGKKKLAQDRSIATEENEFRRKRDIIAECWSDVASVAARITSNKAEKRIAETVLRAKLALAVPESGSTPN